MEPSGAVKLTAIFEAESKWVSQRKSMVVHREMNCLVKKTKYKTVA